MDLVGSSLALLVLFPILLFAAIRIRRFDGGPIYYSEPRLVDHQPLTMIHELLRLACGCVAGKLTNFLNSSMSLKEK